MSYSSVMRRQPVVSCDVCSMHANNLCALIAAVAAEPTRLAGRDTAVLLGCLVTCACASIVRVLLSKLHSSSSARTTAAAAAGAAGASMSGIRVLVQCFRILTYAVPVGIHSEVTSAVLGGCRLLGRSAGILLCYYTL
jgi:hypothetical protein